jgi:hypothetical protein
MQNFPNECLTQKYRSCRRPINTISSNTLWCGWQQKQESRCPALTCYSRIPTEVVKWGWQDFVEIRQELLHTPQAVQR